MFNDYDLIPAGKNVIISNQPYFYKKAELFPGSAFIIGADTAARLVNVRNYLQFFRLYGFSQHFVLTFEHIMFFPSLIELLIAA